MARPRDLSNQQVPCLLDHLKLSAEPALRYSNTKTPISYRNLHSFVRRFTISTVNKKSDLKPIVAIILPNGPLLAATIVAVSNTYIAAPINPAAGQDQVRADIELSGACAIITCPSEAHTLQLGRNGIDIFYVVEDRDVGIRLQGEENMLTQVLHRPTHNEPGDIAMVLFTSGTSGNRKVVPITVGTILHGVQTVIDSWGLTDQDVCLNMMPLYHVGGIIRNLFAPLFSGGSTICCPSFDPNLFWDQVEDARPTWYYASPTMHSLILEEGEVRLGALQKSRIRLVCNAAGSLLPTLAERIRDTFQCTVLPSYGMTECMPISTPPLSYSLDRPGTSGIITGPELVILDAHDNEVDTFKLGRICLRGSPLFHGYLRPDGSLDKSAFNSQGWFDTGDIGYVDEKGYLYITGRNKEVINRGGELISPFEVENAIVMAAGRQDSPTFGRISQALAFSVSHETLQEVVGIVLVTPPEKPRVDLRCLHESLRSSLQSVKWPVVIVHMDDVPKRNNKVLRVRLGERLNIPRIDDDTPFPSRHYEALCPPAETELSAPIPSNHCRITPESACPAIEPLIPSTFDMYIESHPQTGVMNAYLAPKTSKDVAPESDDVALLRNTLFASIDGYLVPHSITALPTPLPRDRQGRVDGDGLGQLLKETEFSETSTLADSTAQRLTRLFAEILQLRAAEIPPRAHFFHLGGDSLRAGRLLSGIRAEFGVRVPIDYMFKRGSVDELCEYVGEELARRRSSDGDGDGDGDGDVEGGRGTRAPPASGSGAATCSSTNPFLLLLQLVPMLVVYPLRRALPWTIFMYALVYSQGLKTSGSVPGRLVNVVVSIALARLSSRLVMPWVGIVAKWLIIGRHREGLYPMWGAYHTRWWLAQKIVAVSGKGCFGWTDRSNIWYYRLLGAKIGSGVTLKRAQLGEWDLLDIGDNVTLDRCVVRPMAGEHNTTMYLGKITIGRDVSVGVSSVVAPGSSIPDGACIGARSSSWELQDANEENRHLSATKVPKPHWAVMGFGIFPLRAASIFVYNVPWLLGLVGLVLPEAEQLRSQLITVLHWFSEGERVGWYYLARSLRTFFGPFFIFAFAVLVRKLVTVAYGPLRPTNAAGVSAAHPWRMALMNSLMPNTTLFELTHLFGQHYEATSVAIRLLGGRAGRRIYWPGTGPSIGDYELLDVGNDVVFGSRSHLVTSDGTGSDYIKIKDGAMIADRVVAYPGVTVGEGATLGSGCLTKRGKTYRANGVYVGSKGGDSVFLGHRQENEKSAPVTDGTAVGRASKYLHLSPAQQSDGAYRLGNPSGTLFTDQGRDLEKGNVSVMTNSKTGDGSTSPFGRAFYQHKAPYFVWRQWMIFLYSSFTIIFTSVYWSAASLSSIQVVAIVFEHTPWLGNGRWYDPFVLFALCTALLSAILAAESIFALGIVIAAKWVLLGRRQPGNYDWDKSSYCQRWQLFLAIERIRRLCFAGFGILGLLTGTAYMTWYFRALGAKIGQDCALFVSGEPSLLFTEPDLLVMGDRVVVDDASLVGHINTRGKFDLNHLHVGDRAVLRTNSRLLSGARMENDSCLLENTLIMGGDVVEEGATMQGWPASRVQPKSTPGI
ncbi:acetyl-CoA synthetase-like protein [Nemania sp. NC0429]|nr:acetyl-CoA synthetase-like protein [Nemania sp. NC0429]